MASGQPVEKRAVAGTFLFRFDGDVSNKVAVALFRRSGEVRTYQHKLAPISGSVEKDDANPLATALREIKEETTLDLASIELIRKGKPYSFTDDSINREWTVNPFAFRLKSTEEGGKGEAGITIDWEHEGWEWHDPLKVTSSDDFGGVPKLTNSLRRVWPEYDLGSDAGTALTDGLQRLRTDHESGARQLAFKAVEILRDVIAKSDSKIDDVWWANIRMAAWHLWKNGRESMGAAILSALLSTLDRIETTMKENVPNDDKLSKILGLLDHDLSQREAAVTRIRDSFINFIKSDILKEKMKKDALSILTLSNSSTISSSLLQAASSLGVTVNLRILESRPLCEGVTLASKLIEESAENRSINITLYSDASAAIAAADVDVILFGADRISSEGDVSNKTGTLPAVLSVRHVAPQAKVIVLSEAEKIAGVSEIDDHVIEDNDPLELTQGWEKSSVRGADVLAKRKRPDLAIKNIYFEWIPSRFIDAYITDQGRWSGNDIKRRSEWIDQETDRFFKDL